LERVVLLYGCVGSRTVPMGRIAMFLRVGGSSARSLALTGSITLVTVVAASGGGR
jgi:hypothetical protein